MEKKGRYMILDEKKIQELEKAVEELQKKVQIQEDIEAIRRLRRAYSEAADGGWIEHNGGKTHNGDFAGLFAEDGIWDGGHIGPRVQGRENIYKCIHDGFGNLPFMMHYMSNDSIIIHEDGKTAHGDWHVWTPGQFPDGACIISVGYYHDDYVKIDGKWYFQSVRIESARTGTLNAPTFSWDVLDEDVSKR